MGKYLKKFSNETDYNNYVNGNPYLPNVSLIGTTNVRYNPYDYSKEYLTFEILEDGYFCFTCSNTDYTKTIQYNKNNSGWINLTSTVNGNITTEITVNGKEGTYTFGGFDTEEMHMYYWENNGDKLFSPRNKDLLVGDRVYDSSFRNYPILTTDESFIGTRIDVVSGDIVMFKGNNDTYGGNSYSNGFNSTTCRFEVEGNAMSLIYGDDFQSQTTLTSEYTFNELFYGCTGLTSSENLILPATTLTDGCYMGMFANCSNLTTVPKLLATTLATSCYANMFNECTSLTTVPELPATTLTEGCYEFMFQGCTSLTTAPELPATTLTNNCYNGMFQGCTNLTTAPELPATTLANNCYAYMFSYCTSLTTAPELPATTLTNYCYSDMFYGCTSLTTAPELPATTLVLSCYVEMFYGCSSLNYIKCLATNISAPGCTSFWVGAVSASGTFVKASSADWSSKTGNNGIPSGWTVQDA